MMMYKTCKNIIKIKAVIRSDLYPVGKLLYCAEIPYYKLKELKTFRKFDNLLVSSKRRFVYPLNAEASSKSVTIARACPICR